MAVNWIRRKKGLRGKARALGIPYPKGFNPNTNTCGGAAQQLIAPYKKAVRLRPLNGVWTQALGDKVFPLSFGQLVARVAKARKACTRSAAPTPASGSTSSSTLSTCRAAMRGAPRSPSGL